MSKNNNWRNVKIFQFTGEISPRDNGWILNAHIRSDIRVSCVISGAPILQELDFNICRKYVIHNNIPPQDFSWNLEFDVDEEEIPQILELETLLNESLILALPDFPKLAKYENDNAWQYLNESDPSQSETTRNPFSELRNLIEQKKTGES